MSAATSAALLLCAFVGAGWAVKTQVFAQATPSSSSSRGDDRGTGGKGQPGGAGCAGSCEGETSFLPAEVGTSDRTGHPCGTGFSNVQHTPGGLRLTNHGTGATGNRNCDQIVDAANYPEGAGGKGFRHYRGDGQNNNGGGIKFVFARPLADAWVSFRMRYAKGFKWTGNAPGYTKDLYGSFTNIFGYQGGGWGFNAGGGRNYPSRKTWSDLMGGSTGDGRFHCFDLHWNFEAKVAQLWINGELVQHLTNVDWRRATDLDHFFISNQNHVEGGGTTDFYTDYDDFRIDTGLAPGARIGCPGAGG
jgi:hypothetical protein